MNETLYAKNEMTNSVRYHISVAVNAASHNRKPLGWRWISLTFGCMSCWQRWSCPPMITEGSMKYVDLYYRPSISVEAEPNFVHTANIKSGIFWCISRCSILWLNAKHSGRVSRLETNWLCLKSEGRSCLKWKISNIFGFGVLFNREGEDGDE